MDRLRCVVERITYQNEKNGYSVIKCRVKGYNDLVPVVGAMPEVHVGAVLTLTGEWKMDAKYGRQFSIFSYEETLPATVYGIEKYLGSGLIKGIGPKFIEGKGKFHTGGLWDVHGEYDITLVYMEGKASLADLRRTFKKK